MAPSSVQPFSSIEAAGNPAPDQQGPPEKAPTKFAEIFSQRSAGAQEDGDAAEVQGGVGFTFSDVPPSR